MQLQEGDVIQQERRMLKNAAMVLSLAIVATPLTIDRRGSVGINQALAQGGHRGHSASRAGSGEGSPNDVIADAKEKKAATEASMDAAQMKRLNRLQQQLDAAEMKPSSVLAKLMIEREEKRLQKSQKNI
jgi:hypothetical protein